MWRGSGPAPPLLRQQCAAVTCTAKCHAAHHVPPCLAPLRTCDAMHATKVHTAIGGKTTGACPEFFLIAAPPGAWLLLEPLRLENKQL